MCSLCRDDSITGVDEFLELLYVAVIYSIPGLQFECEIVLSSQIKPTTVGKIMVAAVELKCDILSEDIQTFLCENRRKYLNLPKYDSDKYHDLMTRRSETTTKPCVKTYHSPVLEKASIYTQPVVRKVTTSVSEYERVNYESNSNRPEEHEKQELLIARQAELSQKSN